MNYRFILWDFDGTLADSLALSLAIFNRLAQQMDFRPIDDLEKVRRLSVRKFLKRQGIGWLRLPRVTRAFHRAVRQEISTVPLYPGVAHVLRQLRAAGMRMGILSSNTPENIQLCLKANGVADLFEFTSGCFKLLGKARGIRQVIKQNYLRNEEVLYVGDELRDIEAAGKASIDVAAVAWGFNDWSTLIRARPTHQVASPEELLAVTGVWSGTSAASPAR